MKFGTKVKRMPTVVNKMGETAYKLSAKEELVSTVMTTFLENSYYEKQKDIVARILKAADACPAEFVAKVALYARRVANMRSVSHLLAGYLAKRLSGTEYARLFYKNICQRPDDASEILSYYKSTEHKGKMPSAMKYGFKSYLENLRPYEIDKYKLTNRQFSLKDLANLTRIKPKYEDAWKRLFNGESLEDLYEGKILNKELTRTGAGKSIEEKAELKAEVFAEQLSGKMPIFALVRNLKNILQYAPNEVHNACVQLMDKNTILNSKLLPFRFASAYTEVEAYSTLNSRVSVLFESDTKSSEGKTKILKALEVAIGYSVANIPKMSGKTAILADHSGSVRGDGGGSGKVSAFSKTTTAMIGNLFASMLLYSQDDVYFGMFGDRLLSVPVNRSKGVLEFNSDSFARGSACGQSTEDGLYKFLKDCIDNKVKVDTLVIFSDMVIGNGARGGWDATSRKTYGGFQKLFLEFKKLNPQCVTFSINIRDTDGNSVFDKSLGVHQISGWSEKVFDLITGSARGYEDMIKEIEKMDIYTGKLIKQTVLGNKEFYN